MKDRWFAILENNLVVANNSETLRYSRFVAASMALNLLSDSSIRQTQTNDFLFSKINSFFIRLKQQETKNRRTFGPQLILGMLLQR